jgi:hypothetical protein
MKLTNWELNNFLSISSNKMHYNLCIYQAEISVEKETISFFKYVLESEYNCELTEKAVISDIISNFSSPVATIKLKPPFEDNLLRPKIIPHPESVVIRTNGLFCDDSIKEISKTIKCTEEDTLSIAIFKANLELSQLGFEIDLMSGLNKEFKI